MSRDGRFRFSLLREVGLSVAAAPVTGRSLLGKAAATFQARAKAKRATSRAAAFLTDHTGTLTALGFADAACWHWGTGAGLIGTAVAILVAEFKVRG